VKAGQFQELLNPHTCQPLVLLRSSTHLQSFVSQKALHDTDISRNLGKGQYQVVSEAYISAHS